MLHPAPANVRKGARLQVGDYKVDDRELPSMVDSASAGFVDYIALQLLEGHESDVTCNSGKDGGAPIHFAAEKGNFDALDFLVDHGAGINDRSEAGLTPLMWLAKGSHLSEKVAQTVIQSLLDRGADVTMKDNEGKTAFTYALHKPVLAHIMNRMGGIPQQADLLHAIHLKNMPAARYLLEQHADVVAVNLPARSEGGGEPYQPIEHALLAGDETTVKMLVVNGADLSLIAPEFFRPNKVDSKLQRLVEGLQRNGVPKGFTYVPSYANIWMLIGKRDRLVRFVGAATLPNIALLASATYLPAVCGFAALFLNLFGVQYVTTKAATSKTPEPGLAGWYTGGLLFGGTVLVTIAFPASEQEHLKLLWWVVTSCMFMCYLRALSCNPGVHVPTTNDRRVFFEEIGNGRTLEEIEGCPTTLCKKPLRSKFCSTSLKLIHRFDHYCVWTANSIGSGNHRPFFFFSVLQFISQCLVLTFGLEFVKLSSIPEADRTLCGYLDHLFSEKHAVASYFLIFYNTAVIIFIFMVFSTQFWYICRNVTSNEVWFPERYAWCFNIGNRTHTLFDRGVLANWADFLCGDLAGAGHTLPQLEHNPHLSAKIAKQRTMVRAGPDIKAGGGCSHSHGGDGGDGGHSHSHGGDQQAHSHAPPPPPPPPPASSSSPAASPTAAGCASNLVDAETGFVYPMQLKDHILKLPLAMREQMAAKQKAEFSKFNVIDDSGKVALPSEENQSAFLHQNRVDQANAASFPATGARETSLASGPQVVVHNSDGGGNPTPSVEEPQQSIAPSAIRSSSISSRGGAQLRSSTRQKE